MNWRAADLSENITHSEWKRKTAFISWWTALRYFTI